jgi:hypothetical protein
MSREHKYFNTNFNQILSNKILIILYVISRDGAPILASFGFNENLNLPRT